MTRIERLMRDLRAELKTPPAQASNVGEVERILENALAEIRRVKASNRVFVSEEFVTRLEAYLRSVGSAISAADRSMLEAVVAEARGSRSAT